MSSVNIGDSIDPFYRYRRPRALCNYGKNKTTIIINLDDIAKALHTKPSYILYYIQLEKSTSITSSTKKQPEIKMVLPVPEIEKLINNFIEKYILCTVCQYPELVIKQYKSELEFSCEACGNTMPISRDKFTKIIYKDYE